jgi:hypothetical protein
VAFQPNEIETVPIHMNSPTKVLQNTWRWARDSERVEILISECVGGQVGWVARGSRREAASGGDWQASCQPLGVGGAPEIFLLFVSGQPPANRFWWQTGRSCDVIAVRIVQ